MTPDQVQKDLELVLAAANELTQLSDIELESDQPIRAAITRLRSVKLVAVEEAPEGLPSERFVLSRTYHSAQAFSHWCYFPMIPEDRIAAKYIYAGDVVLDENGKVDG